MKLGVMLPYAEGAMTRQEVVEFAQVADRLGYHSVWVAEAWSFDVFMLLASLADHTRDIQLATGIANVYSRTPSLLGQAAATLDALSSGRAILGLGTSGPQVIEGWHGLPFDRPVQRTRETIEIVRTILRRDKLVYDGEIFHLSKGLRLINHPVRSEIPIVVASLGPANVTMTAELANGWMPVFYSPGKVREVFGPWLDAGAARRDAALGPLEIMPTVPIFVTDQPEGVRAFAKNFVALYVGGMGSREKNFYNQLFRRYGYEREAAEIQDLYLSKRQGEAVERVTGEMVDEVSAIGPAGFVKDRLAEFADSGVTTMIAQVYGFDQPSRLQMLEDIIGLV